MSRIVLLASAAFSCLLSISVGCGGGEDAQEPTASIAAGQKASQSGSSTPQAAVVQAFLEAVQRGDRDGALKLLTAKSVQKINENNLPFLPSAIDTGSFRIGQTVQSGNNYFVQCVWADQDANGQPRSETIQWMVKEAEGEKWGIFGMAVRMDQESQPLVINFEQPPEELLRRNSEVRQQELVQQDAAQGTDQAIAPQQAARPQDPFQSTPR